MNRKAILFTAAALVLLAAAVPLSFAVGARSIPLRDLVLTLRGDEVNTLYQPILEKRVIRTVLGLTAGCALGISGCLMQSVTRNPIADPSILGVNTGASFFVVSGIAFAGIHTTAQYIWFALAGSAFTAFLVFGIASFIPGSGGGTFSNVNPIRLALSGAAVSTAFSSLISTVMLPRTNVMQVFRFWQTGSIGSGTWEGLRMVMPFLAAGALLAVILIPSLNVLSLGDDIALGLGVKVTRTRALGALAGILLCGATTAVTGPIGFVGLMVPHICRLLYGTRHRVLVPAVFLTGGLFLTGCHTLSRCLLAGDVLPVGVITSLLGGPFFLWILLRRPRYLDRGEL
ncbi:MAG: iron ABC transporter permease [Thermoguttaceae bacterium]|nr:iron ABC transporter permease [Thermoguttaceae bacterium]